ncbi:MAG TPA: beta-galactosidase trimerization domain-containing protein [Prolixibacteraceae bacterium]|nr:beta-galactosidase trimerization domain-containing protein [Prolixibacteraceae bacterium]
MKIKLLIVFCLLIGSARSISARHKQMNNMDNSGMNPNQEIRIGAQVFIEPGQTAQEIDGWFRTLKENNFTICRIRMFESYMKKPDGTWDFGLFDMAFRAAEKYGIKVYGTFFPYTEKTDIGGFKFPRNDAHLQSIAEFIKQTTTHFSRFNSLHGWVLINEPGVGGKVPSSEFTHKKLQEWQQAHPQKEFTDKGYPILMELTDQAFLLDYTTWFLNWIADVVRKYDSNSEIHVNNHAMFQNCAEYNFPEWRKFLNSLGGSAHASWHFGYFSRPQYAMAMLANSEIVRSGAGHIPWLMTELQGGNNTYSGGTPMCPTQEEIAQWLWIVTATEGKGSIFWSLNPRSSGIEAGEWALLDFQNKPSDRMKAASKVAHTIHQNKELIENLKVVESGINVLYVRQSLWAESKMTEGLDKTYEARSAGAVMKSALGYFEAITQMGVNANFKAFEEFDFGKSDYAGSTIILAHQISLPDSYALILEDFVKKGGKLIVDGLTAFFDENLHNTMKTGFAFENLLGGNISEFKMVDNIFPVQWDKSSVPAHLWRGYIYSKSGKSASTHEGETVALRNKPGKGEVLWIPSLIGLGSRISNDHTALIKLLNAELKQSLADHVPVRFKTPQKDMLMRTLKSGSSYLTVLINKSEKTISLDLDFKNGIMDPRIVYANKSGIVKGSNILISSEETMVIEWK